ncbi:MAG: FGGY family carbohydrate kinase, partial [Planctomycetota bacterium]
MSQPHAHLAIDLGAGSGRAILGTLSDGRLAMEELHRFEHPILSLPKADGGSSLHWDLTGLWRELCEGLRRAGAACRDQGLTLRSIGIDTWGVDFGLIGRSGLVLGNPRAYRDGANDAACARVVEQIGESELYQHSGLQLMALNSLHQLVALRDMEPGLISSAADGGSLLFMPDLLGYLLTGVAANELTISSTSQMLDPRSRSWNSDLLEKLGLPSTLLGDIRPPGSVLGKLCAEVASACQVDADISVVMVAAHDTASAVAAVPTD